MGQIKDNPYVADQILSAHVTRHFDMGRGRMIAT